jgi:hypothetical protein
MSTLRLESFPLLLLTEEIVCIAIGGIKRYKSFTKPGLGFILSPASQALFHRNGRHCHGVKDFQMFSTPRY